MNSRHPAAAAVTFSHLLVGPLALAALLLAGCNSDPNAEFQETVQFNSTPSNATVQIDGAKVGQTPVEAVLAKEHDTEVVIAKPGFKVSVVTVHGTGGHLEPNPVEVSLRTDLLPDKRGADPAAELATCLDNLKKSVAIGNLSPADAVYVEAQIRAFYAPPAAGAAK